MKRSYTAADMLFIATSNAGFGAWNYELGGWTQVVIFMALYPVIWLVHREVVDLFLSRFQERQNRPGR